MMTLRKSVWTPGAINFVYWLGKPAVTGKEITAIRRFSREYENVRSAAVQLKVNQRVRVTKGMLMTRKGKF